VGFMYLGFTYLSFIILTSIAGDCEWALFIWGLLIHHSSFIISVYIESHGGRLWVGFIDLGFTYPLFIISLYRKSWRRQRVFEYTRGICLFMTYHFI